MSSKSQQPVTHTLRTGDQKVQVEMALAIDKEANPIIVLLMGSTGAGKSRFIEALTGNNDLGISKDQLDGYTQEVVAYRLFNITFFGAPIYLVDTPGFCDPMLSEMRVVAKIQSWMELHAVAYFHHLFYFDRISDPRVSGSKFKFIQIFKQLTGEPAAKAVTVVTSMWDTLWRSDQIERAEKRLQQLRSEYWKTWVDQGCKFVRFMNNQESAIEILGHLQGSKHYDFAFESSQGVFISKTPFAGAIQQGLFERLSGHQRCLERIADEVSEAHNNPELNDVLKKQKRDTLANIQRTLEDLDDYGGMLFHQLLHDAVTIQGQELFAIKSKYGPKVEDHLLAEATACRLLLEGDNASHLAKVDKKVLRRQYHECLRCLHLYNPVYPTPPSEKGKLESILRLGRIPRVTIKSLVDKVLPKHTP